MKPTAGTQLTAAQRQEIKRSYIHRYTGEHFPQWAAAPMPNGNAYQPSHPTDNAWIDSRAFYIKANGTLDARYKRCEPAYMAHDPQPCPHIDDCTLASPYNCQKCNP